MDDYDESRILINHCLNNPVGCHRYWQVYPPKGSDCSLLENPLIFKRALYSFPGNET